MGSAAPARQTRGSASCTASYSFRSAQSCTIPCAPSSRRRKWRASSSSAVSSLRKELRKTWRSKRSAATTRRTVKSSSRVIVTSVAASRRRVLHSRPPAAAASTHLGKRSRSCRTLVEPSPNSAQYIARQALRPNPGSDSRGPLCRSSGSLPVRPARCSRTIVKSIS